MEIIGNENIVNLISKLKDKLPFPHTLFYGPPGTGKTLLSQYISKECNAPMWILYPTDLKDKSFNYMLTAVAKHTIIILDEIHSLTSAISESLYQPMEESKNSFGNINPFTLIGTTTEFHKVHPALVRRFRMVFRINLYNPEELTLIGKLSTQSHIDDNALNLLVNLSRGTPGIIRNYMEVLDRIVIDNHISILDVDSLRQLYKLDMIGLTELDLEYLNAISVKPMGLKTLSSILMEPEQAIESRLEPYLFRLGFVEKTTRGRMITLKGIQYLARGEG